MTSVETHRPTPRRPSVPHRARRRTTAPADGPTLGRGTPLPSGRAVVGALLMAVAAVGVFAAIRSAGEGPSQPIVVAAADLPIGHRLAAADLRLQTGLLPPGSSAAGFDTVAAAVGAVTVAPLSAGDVVQRSAILAPDGNAGDGRGSDELSFAVERERALDGELQRGERVDILATYGSGDNAFTTVVARDVTLVDTDAGGKTAGIGSSTKITFTVSLADRDAALRLAHATQVAAVTLVRASRAGGDVPGSLDTFRSPGANPASGASPGPSTATTSAPGTASTRGTARPAESDSGSDTSGGGG